MKTQREKRAKKIIKRLKRKYPSVKLALNFKNPLELLVATILSAQCTDERTNRVTKNLFKKYRSVRDYARANSKTFEKEIRATGFYKNKAKNIIGAAKKILEEFKRKVPDKIEEILTLPGVGRKTANVVLTSAYGKIEGISVDTHVRRLTQRLGLSKHDNPDKIEEDLMEIIPKKDWGHYSLLLMEHGRKICRAKKPLCKECILKEDCPSFGRF